MDSKQIEDLKNLLQTLIPAGTEVEVKGYDYPKCVGAIYSVEPPKNYVIRIAFPFKASKPLDRATNCFSISYRSQTLNIPEDRLRIIVRDIVSQESSERTSIRLKLEAARRRQFLSGIDNIRVSGESTRDDIKIKEILF